MPILRLSVISLLALSTLPAAEPDVADQYYNAIRRDDTAAVEKLLKSAGPNVKDSRGGTPLMYAAAVGSEAMMRRLVDAGADVNAKNSFDATALMWCGDNLPCMKLLVEHGADVNARSKRGHTPLYIAAAQAGGLPSLQLLLAKGANLNVPPAADGRTPIAAATEANDSAMVKFLLEKGGAGILAGPGGPMALMNSASFGNTELVKLLLSKGVNVNSASPPAIAEVKNGPIAIGNLTALILSVAAGETSTVQALLDAGANINAKDVRGMTPIMLAVATDHPNHDIVKMLLARKPDMAVKSKAGETALDWALKFKQPSIVKAIQDASPGISASAKPSDAPAPAPAADARAAVQKTVAFMQTTGATNFKEGGCISCHGGNIVLSTVAAARRKGLRVDDSAAAETMKATRLQFAAQAEGMLERSDPPAVEIMTFALSALADDGVQPDRLTDALVHNVAAQQIASGTWAHGGIMRPPTADNLFTNAAFAIRAFKQYAPPARRQEYDERIARAARGIASAEPSTTEDYVSQLLGLKWAGSDTARVQRVMKSLIALQRPDGGWGQTQYHPTDAYATGTALHALHEAGLSPASSEYKKGMAFLLETQAADGSWRVASRAPKFQPYFEGGFPYGHDQWISQWATGYAAIALSHSLPDQRASR